MVDSLQAEKKSPWSKPLVMGIGLAVVAVLIVGIYAPDVFKLSSGGQTGGKIYEQGTGVAGYLRGIEPSYTMVYGITLDSEETAAAVGFSGKYGIENSKLFSEVSYSQSNLIVVENADDSTSQLKSLIDLWNPTGREAALVMVDESKSGLTIIGGTKSATTYAVNFLRNNQLCDKLNDIILIIPNNAQCSDVYSPMAKISISSNPSASLSGVGSISSVQTPYEYTVKDGTYPVTLTAVGYNAVTDSIAVSLADRLQEKVIAKSYTLIPTISTGSVEIEVGADTGAPILTTASVTLEGPGIVKSTDATTKKVRFDNLNPGDYTFTVRPIESYYSQKSTSVTVVVGQTSTQTVLYRASDISCTPTWSTGVYGACINKVKTREVTKIAGADGFVCPLDSNKPAQTESCCLEAYTQCSESDWTPTCSSTTQITQTRPCNIVAGCEQSTEPIPQKSRQCSSPSQATVIFTTYPAEATIMINGAGEQKQLPLAAGTYDIKVSLASYGDLTTTLTISQSQLGTTVNVPEYVLTPHSDFVFDKIKSTHNVDKYSLVIGTEVNGHKASLSDNIGGSDIAGYLGVSDAYTDASIPQTSNNLIVVGGPCVNSKVASLAADGKFPYTCSNWPGSNFVIIKQIQEKSKSVIVIAGTNAEDTRRGGRIVARLSEFRGKLAKQEVKLCPVNQDVNSADYKDINKIQDCSEQQTCAQVITYGTDGAGICREYQNSCLPPGITQVDSCPVSNPPTITTSSLSGATNGQSYSAQLSATGGSGTYTYSVSSGTLPTGLSLSASGLVSGTPTASGTFTFNIVATSNNIASDPKSLTITVASATIQTDPLSFTYPTTASPTLKSGKVKQAYSDKLSATGGSASLTYSIYSGSLPIGVTLSSDGTLSGTPTDCVAKNYYIKFKVTDSTDASVTTGNIKLVVFPADVGSGC